jgi:hypothetical protein
MAFIPTSAQREWLLTEAKKLGVGYSTIIKMLISEKMPEAKANA